MMPSNTYFSFTPKKISLLVQLITKYLDISSENTKIVSYTLLKRCALHQKYNKGMIIINSALKYFSFKLSFKCWIFMSVY